MGTNFYLMSKNKELIKKHFGYYEYQITDEPFFGYEVHICKRSCGWQPLFQKHKMFSTFAEFEKFMHENILNYKIYDEYGKKYSLEQFKKEMIKHSSIKPQPYKWVYKNDPLFDRSGEKSLDLELCSPEEAELYSPFVHEEYKVTYQEAQNKYTLKDYYIDYDPSKYDRDPDYKFDWVEGEFS